MALDAGTGVLVCALLAAGAGVFLFSAWLLTRLRRVYKTVNAKLSNIETDLRELRQIAVSARIQNFNSNSIARNHLAALSRNDQDPPEICYALSRIVRSIQPTIAGADKELTICSVALGAEYVKKVAPALASHKQYAQHHGYALALLSTPSPHMDRPASWMKIPLFIKLFMAGHKKLLYIDADALVTNKNFDPKPLFDMLDVNRSMMLTEDQGGINAGVWLLVDSPATRRILDLIWLFNADPHHPNWEQNALQGLFGMFDEVRRHFVIEPNPKRFNSFPVERKIYHLTPEQNIWQPGDFICHFSGIRSPDLEMYLSRYANEVAPPESSTVEEGAKRRNG
jgi:hypothetical protein